MARNVRETGVAGVELASGVVRVVIGRADAGRLRIAGAASVPLEGDAVECGLVVDRAAVASAVSAAFSLAERGMRAEATCVAIDGDDVRTYHVVTPFERESPTARIAPGELERAVRNARLEALAAARRAADDESAPRGVATTELRDDPGAFVLDGRRLPSPVGFQGRMLEVRTDVALAPVVLAGAAAGALDAARRRGSVASGIYALARLLAESGMADGAVLRLGADVTATAFVREGHVVATRTFGLGREAFAARAGSLEADAAVWARCVTAPLAGVDAMPARWRFVGVPESLLPLPRALGAALAAARGEEVDLAPLRTSDAGRVVATVPLHSDDLVAAGCAALAAEAYAP